MLVVARTTSPKLPTINVANFVAKIDPDTLYTPGFCPVQAGKAWFLSAAKI
jgi:hypothetical protein